MVYGLYDIRGDDTVKSARWTRFEAEHLSTGHPNYFTPIRRWNSPWLDRLAVRWVMTGPGEPPPPAGRASDGWRLAYDGADARVWERAGPLPRAWWEGEAPSNPAVAPVAESPEHGDGGGREGEAPPAPTVTPIGESSGLGDRRSDGAGTEPGGAPTGTAATVEVTASAPGRIELSWTAPQPGVLVVSERHDPGWSARAGDRRLPVHAAGGVLLGVELGPGKGELELVYRPAGIGWGAAASAAALAVVLVLVVRRRRCGLVERSRTAVAADASPAAAGAGAAVADARPAPEEPR
jgi:hypothetical protein